MATVVEGYLGMALPRPIEFVGDIKFVVAGCKQQNWQHRKVGIALCHTAIDPILDRGVRQFQKAGNDGTGAIEVLVLGSQIEQCLSAIPIPAAVAHQQKGPLLYQWLQYRGILLGLLVQKEIGI